MPQASTLPVAPPQARLSRRTLLVWSAVCLVILVLVSALIWWVRRPEPMPISAPPPGGGTLNMPPTAGGASLLKADPQPASWFQQNLPQYEPGDARLAVYRLDTQDGGSGAFVTALRGPYTDLPDLSVAAEGRVNVGDVQCANTVFGSGLDGTGPTEFPGYTCWRTSGGYSISVVTTIGSLDDVVGILNGLWESSRQTGSRPPGM